MGNTDIACGNSQHLQFFWLRSTLCYFVCDHPSLFRKTHKLSQMKMVAFVFAFYKSMMLYFRVFYGLFRINYSDNWFINSRTLPSGNMAPRDGHFVLPRHVLVPKLSRPSDPCLLNSKPSFVRWTLNKVKTSLLIIHHRWFLYLPQQ